MSAEDASHPIYNELMRQYKEYNDSFTALYKLNSYDREEINKVYNVLKMNLIESKLFDPKELLPHFCLVMESNNRYFKSYWTIIKMLYEEYHITGISCFTPITHYFFVKEYNITPDPGMARYLQFCEESHYTLDVHEKDTLLWAIMEDEKNLFINLTDNKKFNPNQRIMNLFYPSSMDGYSLLELCCYHGAVNCFKILLSKFKPKITQKCLQLSFLSGVPDILNECLKYQKPDQICMKNAYISRNIDFISFLINEKKMKFKLENNFYVNSNLQAFAMFLDVTRDFNQGLIYSPGFKIPSLVEYLLAHGARVNSRNSDGDTALLKASWFNNSEIEEMLISKGASVNTANNVGTTPLHMATMRNAKESVKTLIKLGADIEAREQTKLRPLHMAVIFYCADIAEILISHGANIEAEDSRGYRPIHHAVMKCRKESAELLLAHGANIEAEDKNHNRPIHLAAENGEFEIVKLFIEHGAKIDARGKMEPNQYVLPH